jgi:hypothetical protein
VTRGERGLLAGALISALGVRLVLIHAYPDNFSMDGYQRWAGREHLLVQDWLPATQAIVHTVASLGGGVEQMRWAMAIVAALAVGAGAMVARELGGVIAGWLFVPLAMFGPFLTWSVVPYQEGTYLLTVLGAVALVLRGKRLGWAPDHRAWLAADLLAGGAALVRYEGWVFVLLYMAWRRDKRVLRAAWGAAFWLGVKLSGMQGHAASPVDFADWGGLGDRFSAAGLGKTLGKLHRHAADTWLYLVAGIGMLGTGILWRRRIVGVGMLLLLLGLQLAATLGWMIGLETATYRMQAVPGVLLGLLAAGGLGRLLQGRSGWLVAGALLLSTGLSGHFIAQAHDNAKRSTRAAKWERRLVRKMNRCAECRWAITPRRRIGTRDRHDGCEIIQGLGEFKHGEDFWCTTWPGTAPFVPTHHARWKKGGYAVVGE